MLEVIIPIVCVVVVFILAIIIFILVKKRKKQNKSHDELIIESRNQIERNYKKLLSLYELYKSRLSQPAIDAIEDILPKMRYCSPSTKDEVWRCDRDIEDKLKIFEKILNSGKFSETDTKDILFGISASMGSRFVEL